MLADRYRPQTWAEVAGNDRAIERIADLAAGALETGDPLVLLLTGPAGGRGASHCRQRRPDAMERETEDRLRETLGGPVCTHTGTDALRAKLGHAYYKGDAWQVSPGLRHTGNGVGGGALMRRGDS